MELAAPRTVPTVKKALPVGGHLGDEIGSPIGPFMMATRLPPFVIVLQWRQGGLGVARVRLVPK
jgi:hypothetical protein